MEHVKAKFPDWLVVSMIFLAATVTVALPTLPAQLPYLDFSESASSMSSATSKSSQKQTFFLEELYDAAPVQSSFSSQRGFIESSFADVPYDNRFFDAVEYGLSEGIIKGYDDGTFKPDQPINRAEFSTIVVRTLFAQSVIDRCLEQIPDSFLYTENQLFPDTANHFWYADYLCAARMANIVNGYPDGTFRPALSVNAAEGMKILAIAFNLVFADVARNSEIWFLPYATALEDLSAIPQTITRFEKPLTRGEMMEMIYRLREGITDKPSARVEIILGREVEASSESSAQSESGPVLEQPQTSQSSSESILYLPSSSLGPSSNQSSSSRLQESQSLSSAQHSDALAPQSQSSHSSQASSASSQSSFASQ